MDFDAIFRRGPRELGDGVFSRFYRFWVPPGSEKEATLELASAFFDLRDFDNFRGVRREGPAAEGGAT